MLVPLLTQATASPTVRLREQLESQQRQNNLTFHWESVAELESNWAQYASRRSQCEWRVRRRRPRVDVEESLSAYNHDIIKFAPLPVCDPFCDAWPGAQPEIVSTQCEVAAGDETRWRIQRIGPIVSQGGKNFIVARDQDVFGLSKLLARDGSVSIRSVFLAAVSSSTGAVLGYPPIHSVQRDSNPSLMAEPLSEARVLRVQQFTILTSARIRQSASLISLHRCTSLTARRRVAGWTAGQRASCSRSPTALASS